jgi:hypothetical protein
MTTRKPQLPLQKSSKSQDSNVRKPNPTNIANEDESDDDETKEQIAKQAKDILAQKITAKENNPLDRFKPDDDFDETIRVEDTSDKVDQAEMPTFTEWLWSKEPPAPDLWKTSSDRELSKWIHNAKKNPFLRCCPVVCLKVIASRKTSSYSGQYDEHTNAKDGVGVYLWPDPPFGEGSSYYGLWRNDKMSGHGLLTFYDGDLYLGNFDQGEYHGYGVYKYSDHGAWKGDIYEGRYFKGLRQGSGVYYYIVNEAAGKQGAVYIGEWIRGTMQGLGILT